MEISPLEVVHLRPVKSTEEQSDVSVVNYATSCILAAPQNLVNKAKSLSRLFIIFINSSLVYSNNITIK